MSAFMAPPPGYQIEQSNDLVAGISTAMRTRFRSRAERKARKLNRQRTLLSYHWKVVAIIGTGRYEVRAFQNYLVPLS